MFELRPRLVPAAAASRFRRWPTSLAPTCPKPRRPTGRRGSRSRGPKAIPGRPRGPAARPRGAQHPRGGGRARGQGAQGRCRDRDAGRAWARRGHQDPRRARAHGAAARARCRRARRECRGGGGGGDGGGIAPRPAARYRRDQLLAALGRRARIRRRSPRPAAPEALGLQRRLHAGAVPRLRSASRSMPSPTSWPSRSPPPPRRSRPMSPGPTKCAAWLDATVRGWIEKLQG